LLARRGGRIDTPGELVQVEIASATSQTLQGEERSFLLARAV
jgi:hypothetical protein